MRKLVGLLVAVAACGDDGVHHLADAPPAVDAVDGSSIDAMPLPVTITVTQNGAPVAAVKVYFQAPDSTEISSTVTDASGVASAMMPHGGFVTALDPFPPPPVQPTFVDGEQHVLKTFADVKGGDHLVLTDDNTSQVTPTITVNLAEDTGGAPSFYHVYASCGGYFKEIPGNSGSGSALVGTTPTASWTLYGCRATTSDFLVIDTDSTGAPLNSYVMKNVAIVDQGTVDLTAGVYAGVTAATFNLTGAPAALTGLEYDVNFATPNGVFNTAVYDLYAYPTLTAGAGSFTTGIPAAPGSMLLEEIYFDSDYTYHQLDRWGATPGGDGSYTHDLANLQLQEFSSLPSFDLPTNAFSWTTNPGATPDLYVLELNIQRTLTVGSGGNTFASFDWDIVGAFSGASVKLPTLPGDAAVFNPNATDDTVHFGDLYVAKAPGGYDAVRAHLIDLWDNVGFNGYNGFVTGASGHYELANATQPGFAKRAVKHPRWAPSLRHAKRR